MVAVSIVATVLNEAADIEALVESLARQTLAGVEVVVVDGGSADGTWEWLVGARSRYAGLIAIRDESCSLKRSPGPIARGRNVGIRAALGKVLACADCGCTYAPDWVEKLTAPILAGDAEYALGGSWIDPAEGTLWDVASAPFFGVKLAPVGPTKSCTARSMAFTRELWERVGGFPETVFLGEDTMFDAEARRLVAPAFPAGAKALYRPQHGLARALRQLASYATTDGLLGVRPARLMRNLFRCVAEVAVLGVMLVWPWGVVPFAVVLGLEVYFAFRLDWRWVRGTGVRTLGARLLFSLLVPWVVMWCQVRGGWTKRGALNRQNA